MKPGTIVQHFESGRLAVVCPLDIDVIGEPNVVLVRWVHSGRYAFGLIEDFGEEISVGHIFMLC